MRRNRSASNDGRQAETRGKDRGVRWSGVEAGQDAERAPIQPTVEITGMWRRLSGGEKDHHPRRWIQSDSRHRPAHDPRVILADVKAMSPACDWKP